MLRLPLVQKQLYCVESTVFISSLVVVFPFVPVIPIIGMFSCSRCIVASFCKVDFTSSTSIQFLLSYFFSSIIEYLHPPCIAFSANLFPLNLSPFKAKNKLLGSKFLLSVQIVG